jgi:putative heme-binding domain-containing protein
MNLRPTHLLVIATALAVAILPAPAATPTETIVPASLFATEDPSLEVTVWAASPAIKNPTNIDTDQFGRIWVAEGVNYRRHYERQPEGDRIVVLQDTDSDGKADKSWTFVQEPFLRAPMGIAVIDNKVIVSMAPDLVVYTDVNRDTKFDPAVDKREVLLTGFNGRMHDHTVHSVTVGPDGQWYWNAGNCGAMFTDKSGKTFRIGSSYDPYYGRKPAGDLSWDPREIAGQTSDDGHVYVGGCAARMNPDGSGVVIQSLIAPFADIAHGYGAHEIKTKNELRIEGLMLSDGNPVVLTSAGGLTQMIPANRIASKKPLDRSLMWTPEALGLTGQDVAGLVAYLKSL